MIRGIPDPEHPYPPIPAELHSEYEERPFRCCTRCGEGLVDYAGGYRISKVIRRGEVIFEYALCADCVTRMMEESSVESREKLNQFHESRARPVQGMHDCALCDRSRDDLESQEFALVAGCLGMGLVESHMVCIHCMDEMSALVSEETRNQWNRFVEENFPGVPADFAPVPMPHAPVSTGN